MSLIEMEYIEIYVDSRDAVQTSPPTLITDWPSFRFDTPVSDIAQMKVLEAEIPFSYYTINQNNNSFTLSESLIGSTTVTIPEGNYNSTTITSTLSTLLSGASLAARTYSCSYSNTTGKLAIVASSGPFVLQLPSTSLQIVLGLNAYNTSTGPTLLFPNVAQLTGENYLYLNSDKLGSIFQTYLPTTAQQFPPSKGPQISRIPVDVNPGEVIYYSDPAPEKWFDTQNLFKLQNFDLYFTLGSSNQKVSFNGQGFSIKLGLLINPAIHNRSKQNASFTATKMVMG
jgi:hypothetical protein